MLGVFQGKIQNISGCVDLQDTLKGFMMSILHESEKFKTIHPLTDRCHCVQVIQTKVTEVIVLFTR